MRSSARRRCTVLVAACLAVVGAASPALADPAGSAASPESVITVHPGELGRTFGADTLGAGNPSWNGALTSTPTVRRIQQLGIDDLDFDSGGPSDLYDFRTNTLRADPDKARDRAAGFDWSLLPPTYTFDRFESVAHSAGVQTTVHVNYGTGTPAEAAAWVRYANVTHHYAVHDWMVGEELYFDQFFEPNRRVPHTMRSAALDARDYARGVIRFAHAMKAVDPSIRVGAEAFAVPAALAESGEGRYLHDWTRAMIRTPGLTSAVGYVDIHWFGDLSATTIGEQLRSSALVAPTIGELRDTLDGRPDGRSVAILAGEVNAATGTAPYNGSQGVAAFLADTELALLTHGVEQAQWFALYSGALSTPGDDIGLVSSGQCQRNGCQPPIGTPFPSFYAQQLVSRAVVPGAQVVAADSTDRQVAAYAVRLPNGRLAALLVNRNQTSTHSTRVQVAGRPAGGDALVEQAAGSGITTRIAPGADAVTLPPCSITLVELPA